MTRRVLRIELQLLGDELPGEANRVALEVVAEREVAEHLEERVVPRGVADLLEIVVLAAGAHALLRRRRATLAVRRILHAEEDLLELHHAGVGEQQRRVVGRDERGAGADGVALPREIVEEAGANLGGEHRRAIYPGRGNPLKSKRERFLQSTAGDAVATIQGPRLRYDDTVGFTEPRCLEAAFGIIRPNPASERQ